MLIVTTDAITGKELECLAWSKEAPFNFGK